MPLMYKKSKKAFEHNLKAEMHAGKPQKQSLAIAFNVQRKAKKTAGGKVESGAKDMNMAEGGAISASNEKRPMPDQSYNDSESHRKNNHMSPARKGDDAKTGSDTSMQAKRGGKFPLKHPKMVPQSAYSTKLRDQEDDLQESAMPSSPKEQPKKWMDEEGPDRQGPSTPDLKLKKMAHGGMSKAQYNDPMDDDQPSMDEGAGMAHNRTKADMNGPGLHDTEDEHSTHRSPYAGGGEISDDEENIDDEMELNPAKGHFSKDDSEDQPIDEEELEHAASLAAAVMAKRKMARGGHVMDSDEYKKTMSMSDEEHKKQLAKRERAGKAAADVEEYGSWEKHQQDAKKFGYARGGKILSEDSMDSDDSDQVDLARNAEEDANMEDKASFDALRKENYSESEGLDELGDQPHDSNLHGDDEEMDAENEHDMVAAIRRKMKSTR